MEMCNRVSEQASLLGDRERRLHYTRRVVLRAFEEEYLWPAVYL